MKNQQLEELIRTLKEKSSTEKVNLWKRIAIELEKPTRNRRVVNLFKINKYTNDDDIVIVPGKVLSEGEIEHKVTIAAYSFSETALNKINQIKGKALSIKELMDINSTGKKIKIIG